MLRMSIIFCFCDCKRHDTCYTCDMVILRKTIVLIMFFAFAVIWISYSAVEAGEQSLHGRIVILDAGHGEENPNTYEGYFEHIAMLALAEKIKPILESRGAVVYMTRETDRDVELPVRTAMINKWALTTVRDLRRAALSGLSEADAAAKMLNEIAEIDALMEAVQSIMDDPKKNAAIYMNYPFDYRYSREIHPLWRKVFEYEDDVDIRTRFLVISLHSNATPLPINTSENGAEAYYITNDLVRNMYYYTGYSNIELNSYFAEQILDNIDALGIKKREASGYYYHILRENNLPCVLVENGFHTNAGDRAKLSDDAFLNELAMVYADTIWDYFIWLGPLRDAQLGVYDGVSGMLKGGNDG